MRVLRKRATAWTITILIIILSTIISGGSSLNKLRQETIDIFYLGEKMNGVGIQHDLNMIMTNSVNLTVVAGRYLGQGHELIQKVLNARDALNKAETPGEKYDAAQELLSSVTELYTYLGNMELKEKDQNFRESLYAEINSHNIKISRSAYNQYSRKFNNLLNTFPANILSKVAFIRPVELYE